MSASSRAPPRIRHGDRHEAGGDRARRRVLAGGLRQLDPHPAVVARGQPSGPGRCLGARQRSRLRPAPVTRAVRFRRATADTHPRP